VTGEGPRTGIRGCHLSLGALLSCSLCYFMGSGRAFVRMTELHIQRPSHFGALPESDP